MAVTHKRYIGWYCISVARVGNWAFLCLVDILGFVLCKRRYEIGSRGESPTPPIFFLWIFDNIYWTLLRIDQRFPFYQKFLTIIVIEPITRGIIPQMNHLVPYNTFKGKISIIQLLVEIPWAPFNVHFPLNLNKDLLHTITFSTLLSILLFLFV